MWGTTKLQWFIAGILVCYELLKVAKKNGWLTKGQRGGALTAREKRAFVVIATCAVAIAAWPLWLSHSSSDSAAIKQCIDEQMASLPSSDDRLPTDLKAEVHDAHDAAADFCRKLYADAGS